MKNPDVTKMETGSSFYIAYPEQDRCESFPDSGARWTCAQALEQFRRGTPGDWRSLLLEDFGRDALLEVCRSGEAKLRRISVREGTSDQSYMVVAAALSNKKALVVFRKESPFDSLIDVSGGSDGSYCAQALKQIYGEICVIDYAGQTCRMLRCREGGLFPAVQKWDAGNLLKQVREEIHLQDRERFEKIWELAGQGSMSGAAQNWEFRLRYQKGTNIWHWADVAFLHMGCREGEDSVVLCCVKDIDSVVEEETAQTRRENRLDFIVRESYDEIYEVDLANRLCHFAHISGQDGGTAFESKPFGEPVFKIKRGAVHPDDAPMLREIFDMNSAMKRFRSGEKEITAEYRVRRESGGYDWMSMCMKPLSYPDKDQEALSTVLLMLKDISQRKHQEEAARRLQTKYFLALRSSCGHICDVNVHTGRYELSITGDDPLERAPREGDFARYTRWMARNCIHPEDAERWLENMTLENMKKAFSAGRRQFSIDYRLGTEEQGWLWRSNTAVMLKGETPEEDSILIFARDIGEQKKAERLEVNNRLLRQEIDHQKKVANRDARYRIILEQMGAGIFEWQHDGNQASCMPGMDHDYLILTGHFYNSPRVISEYRLESENVNFLKTLLLRGDIHPEDVEGFEAFRNNTIKSTYWEYLCRVRNQEGYYLWHKFGRTMLLDSEGYVERMVGTVLNVDRETRANRALEMSNTRYRTVLQQTDTIEFEYDLENHTGYYSPWLLERYDVPEARRLSGEDFYKHLNIYPDDQTYVRELLKQFFTDKPPRCELRFRIRDKAGNYVWCRVMMDFLRDNKGGLTRILGTLRNVDSETKAYEALRQKAERDALTEIWNQDTFFHAVDTLLASNERIAKTAMIMMDIDKFKVINEIYGMEGGNRALRFIGRILRRIFGTHGYYARMYADVFCLLTNYEEDTDLVDLMTRIIAALSVRAFDYMLVPCFGVCRLAASDTSSSALVEMAGFAHKVAKATPGKQWVFYDETMRSKAIEQKQLESEMEHALRGGQFLVYLQPKYRLACRSVEGAEALVRWNHPQRGLIPPSMFIPLFEENGFIIQLDIYVWETVCKLLRKWIDSGEKPVPISVNVSRMHIYNQHLRETLVELTNKYQIPRDLLELELTESMFPDNLEQLYAMMARLREDGFVLAMDDFGSGYSSLNMLKDMPIDVLKIDCEFFGETEEEARGRTVVRHTVAMAHELAMRVVAEGVETGDEANFLSDTGCDTAQGFYFSRPVPIEEFERQAFPSA